MERRNSLPSVLSRSSTVTDEYQVPSLSPTSCAENSHDFHGCRFSNHHPEKCGEYPKHGESECQAISCSTGLTPFPYLR